MIAGGGGGGGGGGGSGSFCKKINNLATQSWEKNSGLCSIESKKNNLAWTE